MGQQRSKRHFSVLLQPKSGFLAFFDRLEGVLLRHWFPISRSPIKIAEMIFWPLMNVVLWGLVGLSVFAMNFSIGSDYVTSLIVCVILWETFFRSLNSIFSSFLEEVWAGNIVYLFASPVVIKEWVVGSSAVAAARGLIAFATAWLGATALFSQDLTPRIAPFFATIPILIMLGLAFGLAIISAMIRWGVSKQGLIWMLLALLGPMSCIYYPAQVFPSPLRDVALALPTTQIFEFIRDSIHTDKLEWYSLAMPTLSACAIFICSLLLLRNSLNFARRDGSILRHFQ